MHPMTLAQWLKVNRVGQQDFAKKVGTTQGHISRLASGKRREIGAALAFAIERETRGAVPVAAWAKPRRRAAAASR